MKTLESLKAFQLNDESLQLISGGLEERPGGTLTESSWQDCTGDCYDTYTLKVGDNGNSTFYFKTHVDCVV